MKKLSFFLMLACSLSFFSCSSEDAFNENEPIVPGKNPELINQNGGGDGVSYSLKSVAINPDVIVLNDENTTLLSSEQELTTGILKVTTTQSIKQGDVLYLSIGDEIALKEVSTVKKTGTDTYELQTTEAQLGQLFHSGELDLSIDMTEASKAYDQKNQALRASTSEIDKMYEFNFMDEYQWGEKLKFNPATNLKIGLYMKMTFEEKQSFPKQITTYFEIKPTMNPLFSFTGSVNETYNEDIVTFIPKQLIDYLKKQEFKITIPVNRMGIKSLPAKVKISKINIPTTIDANIAKVSDFTFKVSGSFKIGYTLDFNGSSVTMTPIYENHITAENPKFSELQGELATNSEVKITPIINVLNGFYRITGDITFGLKTETSSNVGLTDKSTFGTKAEFSAKMNTLVDLITMKVPVEILNSKKELWNIGTFNKTVVFSDLSWKVTPKFSTNVILMARMYETDFNVNYKYGISDKKVPKELLISYEVYQDNNKALIQTVKDQVITPADVTANSFKFKLNIPYKGKFVSYQTKSYIRNIVIKDHNGYVYEGIFNTAKGINENSFEIKR